MTMAPSDFAQSRRCIEISSRKNANFNFYASLRILRNVKEIYAELRARLSQCLFGKRLNT